MMANFTNANLTDAEFDYANLEATVFQGAKTNQCQFPGAFAA